MRKRTKKPVNEIVKIVCDCMKTYTKQVRPRRNSINILETPRGQFHAGTVWRCLLCSQTIPVLTPAETIGSGLRFEQRTRRMLSCKILLLLSSQPLVRRLCNAYALQQNPRILFGGDTGRLH